MVIVDGLCDELLAQLVRRNGMHHLAGLADSAAAWKLVCPTPASPATSLTTMQTGLPPSAHGVLDDYYFDHKRKALLPHRVETCAALGQPESSACSLRLPLQHRAVFLRHHVAKKLGPDAALAGTDVELAAKLWNRSHTDFDAMSADVERTRAVLRQVADDAETRCRNKLWRFFQLRISVLGRLLGRAWHQLELGGRPGANRLWVARLQDALAMFDETIGRLADLAMRQEAGLLLVGPFGFAEAHHRITVNQLFENRGLLHPATGSDLLGYRWRRMLWKTRRRLSRRASRHPDETAPRHPLALVPFDRRRSVALTLHGRDAALVYLNTPARFDRGPIDNQSRREHAIAEVIGALKQACDPADDQPLFAHVYRLDEQFAVDPISCCLPDVVGIPTQGYQTRHRLDRKGRVVRAERTPPPARTARGLALLTTGKSARQHQAFAEAQLADVPLAVMRMLGIERAG